MKILVTALVFLFTATAADAATSFIRINQAGYRSDDNKVAVAFSNDRLEGRFTVWNARGVTAMSGKIVAVELPDLASPFRNYYQLDFSRIKTPGRYTIELPDGSRSAAFTIGPYPHFQEDLLFFIDEIDKAAPAFCVSRGAGTIHILTVLATSAMGVPCTLHSLTEHSLTQSADGTMPAINSNTSSRQATPQPG